MKEKAYWFFVIILIILSICGIYNFLNPIKSLNDNEKVVSEGKILLITKDYEYNDNSQYVEKYVAEVLTNNNNEHISINLSNKDVSKYKENDKINYYENKGEFFITDEAKTPTTGGVSWLILVGMEIVIIIILTIKKFKNK